MVKRRRRKKVKSDSFRSRMQLKMDTEKLISDVIAGRTRRLEMRTAKPLKGQRKTLNLFFRNLWLTLPSID